MGKFMPSSYAPLKPDIPIDHPRGKEYAIYVRRIRHPKPFWDWLEGMERVESGKSIVGANLQRWMDDEKFCRSPVKIRINT